MNLDFGDSGLAEKHKQGIELLAWVKKLLAKQSGLYWKV